MSISFMMYMVSVLETLHDVMAIIAFTSLASLFLCYIVIVFETDGRVMTAKKLYRPLLILLIISSLLFSFIPTKNNLKIIARCYIIENSKVTPLLTDKGLSFIGIKGEKWVKLESRIKNISKWEFTADNEKYYEQKRLSSVLLKFGLITEEEYNQHMQDIIKFSRLSNNIGALDDVIDILSKHHICEKQVKELDEIRDGYVKELVRLKEEIEGENK